MNAAMEQLRNHQQQLDADGCMVGVSRQAIDETLEYVAALEAENAKLLRRLDLCHYYNCEPGNCTCDGEDCDLHRARGALYISQKIRAAGIGEAGK